MFLQFKSKKVAIFVYNLHKNNIVEGHAKTGLRFLHQLGHRSPARCVPALHQFHHIDLVYCIPNLGKECMTCIYFCVVSIYLETTKKFFGFWVVKSTRCVTFVAESSKVRTCKGCTVYIMVCVRLDLHEFCKLNAICFHCEMRYSNIRCPCIVPQLFSDKVNVLLINTISSSVLFPTPESLASHTALFTYA